MKLSRNRILSLLTWASAAVFAGCVEDSPKLHEFGVNGHAVLCVSNSDMDFYLIDYANESTSLTPMPGWAPGFGFLFDTASVKMKIPEYRIAAEFSTHPYVNVMSGSVGFLSESDRTRYGPSMRARRVEEIWYATGSCKNSEILPIEGGYRAKCSSKDDYASLWSHRPSSVGRMPSPNDFVLATCRYEMLDIGPYAGATMRTCARVIVVDEFIVDYEFQEFNAKFIRAMDAMITNKIIEWKANCVKSGKS